MLALILAASLAQADAPNVRQLKWNLPIDLTATGLLGAGWLVSEYGIKKQLAPAKCIWCDGNNLDRSFQTLFSPRVGPSGGSTADDASNGVWVAGGLLTLGIHATLAYRDGALREFPIDALIILETVFASMVVNQTVKFLVARERPFVGHLMGSEKANTAHPDDNNLSFYSGHATFTMTLAVAAGTVAKLRNYRLGWVVLAVGVPMSLVTGMLRIAGDKHNFTDVVVGWIAGAGIGFSIPWFFHNVESNPLALSLVPAPGGIGLAGRF